MPKPSCVWTYCFDYPGVNIVPEKKWIAYLITVLCLLALLSCIGTVPDPDDDYSPTVYVTKTGAKYHRSDCGAIRELNVIDSNEICIPELMDD